jgi:hypothetical protein
MLLLVPMIHINFRLHPEHLRSTPPERGLPTPVILWTACRCWTISLPPTHQSLLQLPHLHVCWLLTHSPVNNCGKICVVSSSSFLGNIFPSNKLKSTTLYPSPELVAFFSRLLQIRVHDEDIFGAATLIRPCKQGIIQHCPSGVRIPVQSPGCSCFGSCHRRRCNSIWPGTPPPTGPCEVDWV